MIEKQSKLQTQLAVWLMRQTAGSGVRRVAPVASALATDVGVIRSENQDRIASARGRDGSGKAFMVAAVADGIGGMRNGAECAALALASFFSALVEEARYSSSARGWLDAAVRHANETVFAKFKAEGGSTLAAAVLTSDGSAHWASVGDSRVYLASESKLAQLSVDDTIAGQLGRGAEAAVEQSKLLQFIGMGRSLEPSVSDASAPSGSSIVITSDGVHFLDSTPWFGQIIKQAPDPGVCARRLVELSKWCGGPDNASAAVIALDGLLDESMPLIDRSLEVWDPFGELQVILEPQRQMAKPIPPRPVTPRQLAQNGISPDLLAAADNPRNIASPTPKRLRISRRGKLTEQQGQANEKPAEEKPADEKDAPQLLIEFPNKSR